MKHFEENIKILKEKAPLLASMILAADESGSPIEVVETKQGEFVPIIEAGGRKLPVHSKFDPFKEAERFCSEIDIDKHDLIIVFGFGFGYHIEQFLTKMKDDSFLLVMEKNPVMVKKALQYRDLSAVVRDPRAAVLIDPDEDSIADMMKGKASKNCSFVTHRGSFQSDPGYYSNLLEIARSFLSTKDVNIATLAKFEKVWSANIARNIVRFISSPGANTFYGCFTGMPAIVVAAGPTLSQSFDFIRQNRDRAVIIAVDTAYRLLLNNGIEPHFCVAVDPQVINARYFEGVPQSRTVLVTDPTVHPSVYRLFRGPVVTTGVAFDLMKWIENLAGERGEINHGGSVSTNAYDFAKRIGASPVVLVGQDLAFTGGNAHARGAYLDEQVQLRTSRFYSPEMFNRFQLTALPKIFIRGIKSERVHTNHKMMIFISWFEKRNDGSLVNATIDGAYIDGIEHRDIGSLELAPTDRSIDREIRDLYESAVPESNDSIKTGLQKKLSLMLKEIESLIPVLSRAVGHSENLMALMKNSRRDRSKLDYILNKLSETDRIVESKTNAKDMISFTIQRVIHTITEGFEMDENDRALSDDELVAKKSRYMYSGLLEGTVFNRKVLTNMNVMLERSI